LGLTTIVSYTNNVASRLEFNALSIYSIREQIVIDKDIEGYL